MNLNKGIFNPVLLIKKTEKLWERVIPLIRLKIKRKGNHW
jgi:hypothetical protein